MNIESLVTAKKNPRIPEIAPGDTVKVSSKIVEGGRERIQVFQGVVIRIRRGGNGASFTVRHVYQGIGVERTFPFNSPRVDRVEVVQGGKVRRSKLYYLRGLSGREARKKVKRVDATGRATPEQERPEAEAAAAEPEPEAEASAAGQEETGEAAVIAGEEETGAGAKTAGPEPEAEAASTEKGPEAETKEAATAEETSAEEEDASVEKGPEAESEQAAAEEEAGKET